jgi:hypothetical protein
MSTKNTMGLLLLVEVEPKDWCSDEDRQIYQDLVTAELTWAWNNLQENRAKDPTTGFPFTIRSIKQAVAP